MLVTLSGMLMQVRESHPLKVLFPMLVTLSGMLMLVREWQFEKAYFPILFTLLQYVFANRFISEIYFLNGRKVVTWILQKTKNGKI